MKSVISKIPGSVSSVTSTSFQMESIDLKGGVCYCGLDRCSVIRLSEVGRDITMESHVLYNDICLHKGSLHDSVDQHFPNQHMMQ